MTQEKPSNTLALMLVKNSFQTLTFLSLTDAKKQIPYLYHRTRAGHGAPSAETRKKNNMQQTFAPDTARVAPSAQTSSYLVSGTSWVFQDNI
jgi:hypothetical protein